MKISAFLPCRRGSQRVPNKNVRPFSGHSKGLVEIKLSQLLAVETISEIVLSTDDAEILAYAESLNTDKIRTHRRSEHLCQSETGTDELIGHACDLVRDGHILWTHVTSPFFGAEGYRRAILAYGSALSEGYDSLMAVSVIHGFLWNKQGPVNYNREIEKWPRTQTIAPLYEVNSAVFLASADIYTTQGDRIGARPYLLETDRLASFDIDWQQDFDLAEAMASSGAVCL